MTEDNEYNSDSYGEKPKRPFLEFVFRWWAVIGMALTVGISVAYMAIMKRIYGFEGFTFISWSYIVVAIVLLVLTVFAWFWMRKKLYGIKWGEGGQENYKDVYPEGDKKKKRTTLSESEISDKRIEKIGRKYKKLPPPPKE